jgi:hypothetical protein
VDSTSYDTFVLLYCCCCAVCLMLCLACFMSILSRGCRVRRSLANDTIFTLPCSLAAVKPAVACCSDPCLSCCCCCRC